MGCRIIGCGSYLPNEVITNKQLVTLLDTTEEWIETRTGILQRNIASQHQLTSNLALIAAEKAIQDANIDKNIIDLIIVVTTTPDNTFPSTATKLQGYLGLNQCPSFDLQAVCAGFVYGLHVSKSLIKSKAAKTILLVGAEKMSAVLDWNDRSTAILFGDGAGAVIIAAGEDNDSDIIDTKIYSDGKLNDILYTDGGVTLNGLAGQIKMKGKEVFKQAVERMGEAINIIMNENNISKDEIDYFIPHQANVRIIDSLATKLGIKEEKIIKTVAFHANCSAASIPLALDYAKSQNRLKRGDLILTSAIGAGITWGAALIRY